MQNIFRISVGFLSVDFYPSLKSVAFPFKDEKRHSRIYIVTNLWRDSVDLILSSDRSRIQWRRERCENLLPTPLIPGTVTGTLAIAQGYGRVALWILVWLK